MTTGLPNISRRRSAILFATFGYVSVALTVVQGIVLVPLYLHHLGVALYGAWLASGDVLAWLALSDPGLSTVLQQKIAYQLGANDRDGLAVTMGTGLAAGFALALIPLLLWPAAAFVPDLLHVHEGAVQLTQAIKLGLFGTSCTLLAFFLAAITTGLQLAMGYGVILTVSSLVGLVITIVLLRLGYGLPSMAVGLLVRAILLLVGNGTQLAWWLRTTRSPRLRYSGEELRGLGRLLSLTFVSRLGATLLEKVEAFLIARLISPAAAATVVLTGRSFDAVRMLAVRVPNALVPALAHLAGTGDRNAMGAVVTRIGNYLAWLGALGFGVALILNRQFVHLWVGSPSYAGDMFSIAAAFATAFALLTASMYQMLIASGQIAKVSLATLGEATVRVPLQVVLILSFGAFGMPIATIVTTLIVAGTFLLPLMRQSFGPSTATSWVRGYLLVAAMLVAAAVTQRVLYRVLRLQLSWPLLVVAGAVATALLASALLLFVPAARADGRRILAAIAARRRREPAAGES